mmetsp:Transcript_7798/g.17109  ORF Transcript_7798/g.17109 Transcript_7798/m.17109 type:complete len:234 (-) Transcript_7798:512-1213(-)
MQLLELDLRERPAGFDSPDRCRRLERLLDSLLDGATPLVEEATWCQSCVQGSDKEDDQDERRDHDEHPAHASFAGESWMPPTPPAGMCHRVLKVVPQLVLRLEWDDEIEHNVQQQQDAHDADKDAPSGLIPWPIITINVKVSMFNALALSPVVSHGHRLIGAGCVCVEEPCADSPFRLAGAERPARSIRLVPAGLVVLLTRRSAQGQRPIVVAALGEVVPAKGSLQRRYTFRI